MTKKEIYAIALGAVMDELAVIKELQDYDTEKIKKWEEVADYLVVRWDEV